MQQLIFKVNEMSKLKQPETPVITLPKTPAVEVLGEIRFSDEKKKME